MNIQAAATEAAKTGGGITRKAYEDFFVITPTDTPECCLASYKGKAPCPRWKPKARDLIANDWVVLGGEDTRRVARYRRLIRDQEFHRKVRRFDRWVYEITINVFVSAVTALILLAALGKV